MIGSINKADCSLFFSLAAYVFVAGPYRRTLEGSGNSDSLHLPKSYSVHHFTSRCIPHSQATEHCTILYISSTIKKFNIRDNVLKKCK
jgi:hypothetical protein